MSAVQIQLQLRAYSCGRRHCEKVQEDRREQPTRKQALDDVPAHALARCGRHPTHGSQYGTGASGEPRRGRRADEQRPEAEEGERRALASAREMGGVRLTAEGYIGQIWRVK